MVRIYLNVNKINTLIAVFNDEYIYNDCKSILERYAKDFNGVLVEVIEDSIQTSKVWDMLTVEEITANELI